MNPRSTTLPRFPNLPVLNPSLLTPIPALGRQPLSSDRRPALLWRDGLDVMEGPFAHLEAWAFVTLAVLAVPATLISQLSLWNLLNSGTLDSVIRALLAS